MNLILYSERLALTPFDASDVDFAIEVVATFEAGNVASRNVLDKAGFVDRGTMRCYGEDGPNYRITREEWLKSRQSS